MFICQPSKRTIIISVDDIKLASKTENIEPTWKILMDDVDLGEPTSFLDHVYLGCTQRECQISTDIVTNYRDMFESRIFAGAKENYRPELQGHLMQKKYLLGPMTMEGHAKKCVERYCERNDSTIIQSRNTMHQIEEGENELVGELSTVCSHIFLKCLQET